MSFLVLLQSRRIYFFSPHSSFRLSNWTRKEMKQYQALCWLRIICKSSDQFSLRQMEIRINLYIDNIILYLCLFSSPLSLSLHLPPSLSLSLPHLICI